MNRIWAIAGIAMRNAIRSKVVGVMLVLLALVVPNVALAAAMRRWSVGLAGSMFPWDWNTYNSPVPPVVLLAMSVAASVGLWTWARRLTPTSTGIVAPGEVRE